MAENRIVRFYIAGIAALLFSGIRAGAADNTDCQITSSQINVDRSLVVHKAAIIAKGDFSFARTIGHILKSLGVPDTQANRESMVETMLTSLNASERTNQGSGLRMRVDPRVAEAGISAPSMFDPHTGMKPVALFNRLDLAPADWNNCGEYRIVYASAGTGPTALIFEASLKNPHPELGGKGCRPVAEFWRNLSDQSDDAVGKALDRFYYDGLSAELGPVVRAENYGMALGQIRSNSHVGDPWQLREWKVAPLGASKPSFLAVTTKYNPLVELYSDDTNGALDPAKQEQVRTAFQKAFVDQYTGELLQPDLILPSVDPNDPTAVESYRIELLNTFGAKVNDASMSFRVPRILPTSPPQR